MTPTFTVGFAPGTGRLVRRNSVLLFATDSSSELVGAFDTADTDEAALNEVKKHLVDSAFDAEPVVVVRWGSDTVDLLVFGPVELHSSAVAVPMITGAGSTSWVERRLGSFELGSSNATNFWCGVEAHAGTDLRAGVAAADGFHLSIPITSDPLTSDAVADEPAAPSAPPPVPPAPVAPPAVAPPAVAPPAVAPGLGSPFDIPDEAPPMQSPPVPAATTSPFDENYEDEGEDEDYEDTETGDDHRSDSVAEPADEASPTAELDTPRGLVEAVLCASEHPNRPGVALCSSCSTALAPNAPTSLIPQPVVGAAVFTDGHRLVLDRAVVLGRKPIAPDAETSVLLIDEAEVSREHAILEVDGWTARLTDIGSRNGTYLIAPETNTPVRLDDGVHYVLEHGTTVHLGGPGVAFRFLAAGMPDE